MVTIYWVCFLVGGAFVALAAISGLDGADFEVELDPDVEWVDRRPSATHRRRKYRWRTLPLVGLLTSFKFWTFGSCFFGLTGVLLSQRQPPLESTQVLTLAIIMGLFLGILAAAVLRALGQRQVDSLLHDDELLGAMGTVEIPFDAQSRGKVRLAVKGATLDMIAFTRDPAPLNVGDRVLVVDLARGGVWVIAETTYTQLQALDEDST
ncbi:NfeD-like protein [Synechococcales cyanobacterium C]|uniref:NfeD-like protein n=1 Tax=Petrachloros mirabilis ULC683 TaxID=2781853 RepID=A0A8K2A084_9CYAN|nr:NfeD-like protein [Petrachloros mirabilis]NCJ07052.1 NfeD-like protein [Petrachloros mirabilis ULC683]